MIGLTLIPELCALMFVKAVQGGDVFYYHFNEGQVDRLVPGTPGPFVACDINPTS